MNVSRYIHLYSAFIRISLINFLTYRIDAIFNAIFTSGIWALLNVLSMYVLASKSSSIFGWTAGELILISCIYNVFIGVFGFIFTKGFNDFSEIIDTGRFDLLLLKPVDIQFYISVHGVSINSLIRTVIGIILTLFAKSAYNISVSLTGILLFILTSILGIFLLYSILFAFNIFVMWAPKLDNITELFYSLRSLGRYPRDTFKQLGEVGFVLLSPFVIILATPVKMLLSKGTYYDFFELLIVTIIAFICTRLFWKFALRFYTSASS